MSMLIGLFLYLVQLSNFLMSDIIRSLKLIERSLSSANSNVGYIASDYPDAKSKLYRFRKFL